MCGDIRHFSRDKEADVQRQCSPEPVKKSTYIGPRRRRGRPKAFHPRYIYLDWKMGVAHANYVYANVSTHTNMKDLLSVVSSTIIQRDKGGVGFWNGDVETIFCRGTFPPDPQRQSRHRWSWWWGQAHPPFSFSLPFRSFLTCCFLGSEIEPPPRPSN